MSDPGMCSVCPKLKRVGFALETQGSEPPVPLPGGVIHAFSVAAEGERQELGLFQTVVWLGPEDDPQATTEGCIWRDYTCSQTTAVHQTDDFDYIPVLPRGKGGRP